MELIDQQLHEIQELKAQQNAEHREAGKTMKPKAFPIYRHGCAKSHILLGFPCISSAAITENHA